MKFQPQSDEEIKRAMCAPPGTYDFEVVSAEDKISSKGNPMMVVTIKVFVGGGERTIKDYLMEKMAFKLKHFAHAIGMAKAYDDGGLDPNTLSGCAGKVIIEVQEQDGYGPKNVVDDYVVPGKELAPPKAAVAKFDSTEFEQPPF